MKILFLHSNQEDYVNLGLLHGFRQLADVKIVDVPKYIPAYQKQEPGAMWKYRGHGFSLYGLLPEVPEIDKERDVWRANIKTYDVIVCSFLHATWRDLLWADKHKRPDAKIIIMDGVYSLTRFPFGTILHNLKHHTGAFFRDFSKFIWYKREVEPGMSLGTLSRYLPKRLILCDERKYYFRPIHFSIPSEKITRVSLEQKTQFFSKQVIDKEVAERLPETLYNPLRADQYVFGTESDYFEDLQRSRFGITGKRAGWDCLRHYEMAANGVVMCFKDLDIKPDTCAPHGLNHTNCITYKNYDDLKHQIDHLSADEYKALLNGTYQWVESMTTENTASRLFQEWQKFLTGGAGY